VQHSKIVGGSTAKRVINCPGSVALVAKMPPQVENKYMAEGTMLHGCMEDLLVDDGQPAAFARLVAKHNLTEDQQAKLDYCTRALDEIDPHAKMVFSQEVEVEFEGVKELEGVFGNVDLVGRMGSRAIVLDWKFGDGVMVEAEENYQLMFYAAAAMKTAKTQWAFDGATEIELIIVQPFQTRRWVTTFKRIHEFERELIVAVRAALRSDAPTTVGDWCRFCTAKTICPSMTGAVDRVAHTALQMLDPEQLAKALTLADQLESFIGDARKLAQERLEKGMPVPGYKLVAKRATRQWADPAKAQGVLLSAGLTLADITTTEFLSPAQTEKVCKKAKVAFPTDEVVSVSSGNTIAPTSDPRPAVMVLGDQLRAALNRVQ
jgi:hypothetical protein